MTFTAITIGDTGHQLSTAAVVSLLRLWFPPHQTASAADAATAANANITTNVCHEVWHASGTRPH